ncbi:MULTISPECIES: hypothetical protein [unclassified Crossiella]|uniref:hypothetical protein n=1 Tax=unclassified Crossiella TaxID=2620835 RepID=UPI0020002AB4|nr:MULTISPECIES: hypothetical protein [unclassified Crossiella]MCK2239188.1 hypothetical protein [Crossiella sp. S99.2]MCK2251243.1 hypothetical protein [Crossiella sp. S99.1]
MVIISTPPVTADPVSRQQVQRLEYGSSGAGNPQTHDCTVHIGPGASINAAISRAGAGAVLCVRAGDYRDQSVELNKAEVTLRATGSAVVRGAVIRGRGATLDGFTVAGGDYDAPRTGIVLAAASVRVQNNLVNGGRLLLGISCAGGGCDQARIARNTVTGVESIGIQLGDGAGAVVELNNIYDLHKDRAGQAHDVDAIRFWGRHLIRFNYLHDINEFASYDNPHVDCFQTFNTGAGSAGTVIENNYCLRVSRQCLIAQNHSASSYQIREVTFRNNVCETYDSQGINLGSMSGVLLENNLVLSGFRFQVINLEVLGPGLANTGTTVRNNILVRAESRATTFRRAGASTGERIAANLELLDTSLNGRDEAFHRSRPPYPAHRAADFTEYRDYAAARDIVDKGIAGNSSTADVDGNPRVAGGGIDLGPFEIR